MKPPSGKIILAAILGLVPALGLFDPPSLQAQADVRPPYIPYYRQRISLLPLQNQIAQFQRTCRRAPGYFKNGGYDMLRNEFQALRTSYSAFKDTLSPNQLYEGANDLAELDSALDIIQESFTNYQKESANTLAPSATFGNLANVLSRSVKVWSQQLETVYYRLVGIP